MTRALLIINPSAGGEKALGYEASAKAKLATAFDDLTVSYTEKAGDALTFAKTAAHEHFDAVFVMGGDGTVNEGISGLAEEPYRPAFGFFPLGTVNDLARALKMPLDPAEAIAQIDLSRTKPLDIGKVNDSYFMNVVAIGAIPESINDVDSEEKTKYGKLAYFISGVENLINNSPYRFQLNIDGEEKEITSTTIIIGLTNSIGGFENILPDAEVNDGKLHLIYLKDKNLLETIQAIPSLVSGVDSSNRFVAYQDFKDITISLLDSQETLTLNVDGDEGDSLPVTLSILPSHLQVYTTGD
ncbi:diacylglycerol/lipid kinase family protein [Streptococcus rifensis]